MLALTALQVAIPVALGNLAGILGNHPGVFLTFLALATVLVVAAGISAISPKFRVSVWEIGIFVSSVLAGIILFWAAFALFEVGFFTPFILGLGDRGLENVRGIYIDADAAVTAEEDFGQVFGGYLALAGLVSVPFGGAAGVLGCMSRWRLPS